MIFSAERQLIKLKNELRALKVATKLAWASVLMPDNIPRASWSGSVSLTGGTSAALARFRVRFSRADGRTESPFVDFAQIVSFTPTYYEHSLNQGIRVTGNDVNYVDDQNYRCYVASTGSGYIDYNIDMTPTLATNYSGLSSVTVGINVEAISPVKGRLTITKVF